MVFFLGLVVCLMGEGIQLGRVSPWSVDEGEIKPNGRGTSK